MNSFKGGNMTEDVKTFISSMQKRTDLTLQLYIIPKFSEPYTILKTFFPNLQDKNI